MKKDLSAKQKKILVKLLLIIDIILIPAVIFSAIVLKVIRKIRISRFPISKIILLKIGVFPIIDHYYEPLFNSKYLTKPLNQKRNLAGINWNVKEQLDFVGKFNFNKELKDFRFDEKDILTFNIENPTFASGDADYWYNIIRFKKPKTIIEIGSGYSTLMAINAIKKNREEDPNYNCNQICIEPYEMPWLEKTDVILIREKVEDIDRNIFSKLGLNDILFLDSSHIIRPQGDILCEYLELLPTLKKGVIVHIHDIFSPKDYPKEWIIDEIKFWNEQYLLEAFLTSNSDWKIIGALNYLKNNYYKEISEKCPYLTPDREPGSFYIQKII